MMLNYSRFNLNIWTHRTIKEKNVWNPNIKSPTPCATQYLRVISNVLLLLNRFVAAAVAAADCCQVVKKNT